MTAAAPCPLCRSHATRVLWRAGDRLFRTTAAQFDQHACDACGLRFLSPVPGPEELAAFYPEGYWAGPPDGARRSAGGGLRVRLAELYRRLILHDHVRFVRRVVAEQQERGSWRGWLDVGCGDGSVQGTCGVRPAVGLDGSFHAARAVRDRGLQAVRGGLVDPPFRDGSFSLVSMFHFLEHVQPADAVLRSARRLLAPGGDLIVQVPNAASWQAALLGRRWGGYDVPRHLVHYTPATLGRTLADHGFAVVRATTRSLRDNPTTLVNSVWPSLYPPARAARRRGAGGRDVGGLRAWLGDLTYLGLVAAALPPTFVESLCGRGAAVMVQARPVR